MKKVVLRNFTKFIGKHLCQSLFINKVAALSPSTLLKKRLWHRCFLWTLRNFEEHLLYRTPLDDCFYNHLDLYKHLYCNNKYYVLCGSEAYLEPRQITLMKPFVKIVNSFYPLALRHASLLKRDCNAVGFKWNLIFF